MKRLRRYLTSIALVGAIGLAWAADPTVTQTRIVTVKVHGLIWQPSGDLQITLNYLDPSGVGIRRRTITVKPSRAAFDDSGVLLRNAPAALLNDAADLKTNIETVVSSALTAGKLAP